LMPDFDFDAFNHDTPYEGEDGQVTAASTEDAPKMSNDIAPEVETPKAAMEEKAPESSATDNSHHSEEVDKW